MHEMIIDIAFIILYFSTIFVLLRLFLTPNGFRFQITFVNILILFIILTQFIGLLPLYFQLVDSRLAVLSNSTIIFQLCCITSFTLISLTLGDKLAQIVIGPNIVQKPISKSDLIRLSKSRLLRMVLIWIGFVAMFIFAFKANFDSTSDLVQFFVEDHTVIERREIMNFESGVAGLNFNILFFSTLPLVSLVIFFALLPRGWGYKYIFGTLIILFTCSVLLVGGEKAPLLNFLIAFMLAIALKNSNLGTFKLKFFAKILLGGVIFGYIMMYFAFKSDSGWGPLYNLIDRVLFGQVQSSYFYLDIFPDRVDFLHGKSMPLLSNFFSENVALSRLVYQEVAPIYMFVDGGTSPTIFWGEVYANFGLVPVFIVPVVLGFVLALIQQILKGMANDLTRPAMIGWLCMHYKDLASTSLSSFVFDLHLVYAVLFMVTLKMGFQSSKGGFHYVSAKSNY